MYSKSLVASLILVSMVVSLSAPVFAQSTTWTVTTISVRDITGNATLQPGQALLAGDAYNMTIQIVVPYNQTNTKFQVMLNGFMQSQGPQFWYLKTPNYKGYNPNNFTAGMRTVSFNQVEGTLVLSTLFLMPVNMTIQHAGTLSLHFPLQNFDMVSITVPGATVGTVASTVEDETISTYLATYQTKSTLISSGQVDPSYAKFVDGVLNMSQGLYSMGLADRATSLLNTLNPSYFPAPPNNTLFYAFLGATVVLVIIVIALLLVMMRGRGKGQFAASIANDVQKELATLEVTAAKYDRNLADRLKALRDKLSEAS